MAENTANNLPPDDQGTDESVTSIVFETDDSGIQDAANSMNQAANATNHWANSLRQLARRARTMGEEELARNVEAVADAMQNSSGRAGDLTRSMRALAAQFRNIGQSPLANNMDNLAKSFAKHHTLLGKLATDFNTLNAAAGNVSNTVTKTIKSFGGMLGVQAGIGLTASQYLDFNKNLLVLANTVSRVGVGFSELERSIERSSEALSLTREETMQLFDLYSRGFPISSLKTAENIFLNIKQAVGANSEAMKRMFSDVQAVANVAPNLVSLFEDLNAANADTAEGLSKTLFVAGKISLEQLRGIQEYIKASRTATVEDIKRRRESEEFQKVQQDVKKEFEAIQLEIGRAILPALKTVTDFFKENKALVRDITSALAKAAPYLIGWKAISGAGRAIGGLKNFSRNVRGSGGFLGALGAATGASGNTPVPVTIVGGIPGLTGRGGTTAGAEGLFGKLNKWVKGLSVKGKAGLGVGAAAITGAVKGYDLYKKSQRGEEILSKEKGDAIGGTIGAGIGAALGAFGGPLGVIIGGAIGETLGSWIGDWVGSIFDEEEEKKKIKRLRRDFEKEWADSKKKASVLPVENLQSYADKIENLRKAVEKANDIKTEPQVKAWKEAQDKVKAYTRRISEAEGEVGRLNKTISQGEAAGIDVSSDVKRRSSLSSEISAMKKIELDLTKDVAEAEKNIGTYAKDVLKSGEEANQQLQDELAQRRKILAIAESTTSIMKDAVDAQLQLLRLTGSGTQGAFKQIQSAMEAINSQIEVQTQNIVAQKAQIASLQALRNKGAKLSEDDQDIYRSGLAEIAKAEAAINKLKFDQYKLAMRNVEQEKQRVEANLEYKSSIIEARMAWANLIATIGAGSVSGREALRVKLVEAETAAVEKATKSRQAYTVALKEYQQGRDEAISIGIVKDETEFKGSAEGQKLLANIEKSSMNVAKANQEVFDIMTKEVKVLQDIAKAYSDVSDSSSKYLDTLINNLQLAGVMSADFVNQQIKANMALIEAEREQKEAIIDSIRRAKERLKLGKDEEEQRKAILDSLSGLSRQEKARYTQLLNTAGVQRTILELTAQEKRTQGELVDLYSRQAKEIQKAAQFAKVLADTQKGVSDAAGGYLDAIIQSLQVSGTMNANIAGEAINRVVKSISLEKDRLDLAIKQVIKAQEYARALKDGVKNQETLKSLSGGLSADAKLQVEEAIKRGDAGKLELDLEKQLYEFGARRTVLFKRQTEAVKKIIELRSLESNIASATTSLMEQQVQIMDNFAVGVQASMQMRLATVEAARKERDILRQTIGDLGKQRAEALALGDMKTARNLYLEMLKLRQKDLSLVQKIAQQTKALRDGYVSAIAALTTGAGRITKVLISQQQNLAQGLAFMNMVRGSKSGAVPRPGERVIGGRSSEQFTAQFGGNAGIRSTGFTGYQTDVDKMLGIDTVKLSNDIARSVRNGAKPIVEAIDKFTDTFDSPSNFGGQAAGATSGTVLGMEISRTRSGIKKLGEDIKSLEKEEKGKDVIDNKGRKAIQERIKAKEAERNRLQVVLKKQLEQRQSVNNSIKIEASQYSDLMAVLNVIARHTKPLLQGEKPTTFWVGDKAGRQSLKHAENHLQKMKISNGDIAETLNRKENELTTFKKEHESAVASGDLKKIRETRDKVENKKAEVETVRKTYNQNTKMLEKQEKVVKLTEIQTKKALVEDNIRTLNRDVPLLRGAMAVEGRKKQVSDYKWLVEEGEAKRISGEIATMLKRNLTPAAFEKGGSLSYLNDKDTTTSGLSHTARYMHPDNKDPNNKEWGDISAFLKEKAKEGLLNPSVNQKELASRIQARLDKLIDVIHRQDTADRASWNAEGRWLDLQEELNKKIKELANNQKELVNLNKEYKSASTEHRQMYDAPINYIKPTKYAKRYKQRQEKERQEAENKGITVQELRKEKAVGRAATARAFGIDKEMPKQSYYSSSLRKAVDERENAARDLYQRDKEQAEKTGVKVEEIKKQRIAKYDQRRLEIEKEAVGGQENYETLQAGYNPFDKERPITEKETQKIIKEKVSAYRKTGKYFKKFGSTSDPMQDRHIEASERVVEISERNNNLDKRRQKARESLKKKTVAAKSGKPVVPSAISATGVPQIDKIVPKVDTSGLLAVPKGMDTPEIPKSPTGDGSTVPQGEKDKAKKILDVNIASPIPLKVEVVKDVYREKFGSVPSVSKKEADNNKKAAEAEKKAVEAREQSAKKEEDKTDVKEGPIIPSNTPETKKPEVEQAPLKPRYQTEEELKKEIKGIEAKKKALTENLNPQFEKYGLPLPKDYRDEMTSLDKRKKELQEKLKNEYFQRNLQSGGYYELSPEFKKKTLEGLKKTRDISKKTLDIKETEIIGLPENSKESKTFKEELDKFYRLDEFIRKEEKNLNKSLGQEIGPKMVAESNQVRSNYVEFNAGNNVGANVQMATNVPSGNTQMSSSEQINVGPISVKLEGVILTPEQASNVATALQSHIQEGVKRILVSEKVIHENRKQNALA